MRREQRAGYLQLRDLQPHAALVLRVALLIAGDGGRRFVQQLQRVVRQAIQRKGRGQAESVQLPVGPRGGDHLAHALVVLLGERAGVVQQRRPDGGQQGRDEDRRLGLVEEDLEDLLLLRLAARVDEHGGRGDARGRPATRLEGLAGVGELVRDCAGGQQLRAHQQRTECPRDGGDRPVHAALPELIGESVSAGVHDRSGLTGARSGRPSPGCWASAARSPATWGRVR